ncbi:hypothetical protein [Pantoea sp. BL1]|uniref:hypothetical protein n=1 Tax=Pantoea sp. BL1 TaxID=1628190 RepID=UPI000907E2F2|nr:hypothetical protein [Pantoea sp. BL1]
MIDIVSDLAKKKSEVISLYELINLLQEQSGGATLPQIAEWLITILVNDPQAPDMGMLTVGGGFESLSYTWGVQSDSPHPSLNALLLEIYNHHGVWPGEIPF